MAQRFRVELKNGYTFVGYTDVEDKTNENFQWENIWELQEFIRTNLPNTPIIFRKVGPANDSQTDEKWGVAIGRELVWPNEIARLTMIEGSS